MYLFNLILFCIILFHFQFHFHTFFPLLDLLAFSPLLPPLGLFPCKTVQLVATNPPYPVLCSLQCCCHLSNYTQGHIKHCITIPTGTHHTMYHHTHRDTSHTVSPYPHGHITHCITIPIGTHHTIYHQPTGTHHTMYHHTHRDTSHTVSPYSQL